MMGSLYAASQRRKRVGVPNNPIPLGDNDTTATLLGDVLNVYTYRPSCTSPKLLVGYHGLSRDAVGLRDTSNTQGLPLCLTVVCPLFDEARFNSDAFQQAGIVKTVNDVYVFNDQANWTTHYSYALVEWVRAREGRPTMPVIHWGNSAGGQYVSRLAAFHPPPNTQRIVVSNPSTHVRASLTENIPFGFNGLPAQYNKTEMLKAYLAYPLTIYLGELDNDPNHPDLSKSDAAMRQGTNRLERGEFVFAEGQEVATANGWPFNWRKVIALGEGHGWGGMIDAPELAQAIAP